MLFLSLISLLSGASAEYAADEIISLPGWSGNFPSRQFSGYLDGSNTTHLHYWFVQSENDPANDPVVLWLNGGPGCSSLDGFFYEQGPFEIDRNDYGRLTLREVRWSMSANVIFLEAPVGVGFSYSDVNDYKCNDDRTADESTAALNHFFNTKFPELKNNKFFITGESYGGIYVPTLAEAILKATLDGSYTGAPLTGIAVGNGCSGTELGICGDGTQGTYYEWTYLLQTAFISTDMKKVINENCDWEAAAINAPNALSFKCVDLLTEASKVLANVNAYNIYGDCVSSMCENESGFAVYGKVPERKQYVALDGNGERHVLSRITPHGPTYCIDSAAASGYLNRKDVMEAIHVRDPNMCWSVCSQARGWTYESTRPNLPRDTYPFLLKYINVLIYNGDWDACVPYTDNEGWTENMGFPKLQAWHPWTYTSLYGNENQVAGYAVDYDVSSLGTHSFQFATIRGGRHEVPETSPAQALEMLRRVMNNEKF